MIWEILTGAPWWVYVLFVYLIIVGLRLSRPHRVPFQKLFILPALFLAWSFWSLYKNISMGMFFLFPIWILALGLGIWIGFYLVRSWNVSVNPEKKELSIPGSFLPVVLMVLIFICRFFWGAWYAIHPQIALWVYVGDTLTSSLLSGLLVGRNVFFLCRYFRAEK